MSNKDTTRWMIDLLSLIKHLRSLPSSKIGSLKLCRTQAFRDVAKRRYDWYLPEQISEVPNQIFARGRAIGMHPDFFAGIADVVTRDTRVFLEERMIEDSRRTGLGTIEVRELEGDDDSDR